LRWDDVVYEPGEVKVVAYRNGKPWATSSVKSAGAPARLEIEPDRASIRADGRDLSFITVRVVDRDGITAPRADNRIELAVEGPGEIVATDNGDPTNLEAFGSPARNAFNGYCLVIVRGKAGQPGKITVRATSDSLATAATTLRSQDFE
jgi:beta-galactosidase